MATILQSSAQPNTEPSPAAAAAAAAQVTGSTRTRIPYAMPGNKWMHGQATTNRKTAPRMEPVQGTWCELQGYRRQDNYGATAATPAGPLYGNLPFHPTTGSPTYPFTHQPDAETYQHTHHPPTHPSTHMCMLPGILYMFVQYNSYLVQQYRRNYSVEITNQYSYTLVVVYTTYQSSTLLTLPAVLVVAVVFDRSPLAGERSPPKSPVYGDGLPAF